MIRKVLGLVPPEDRRLLPRYVALVVLHCLAQAAAFVVVAPILAALLAGETGTAWAWIAVLAAAVVVAAVAYYVQAMIGFRIGIDMMRWLQSRLGDHVAALPLGWFGSARTGSLAQTITTNVKAVMGVFAHLLVPLATGILVPIGVALGMLAIDWRVTVAMILAAPLLWLVNRSAAGLYARADRAADTASIEANDAVIEFAQAQPVLRAFGALRRGDHALAGALRRQRAEGRRLVWATVPGTLAFAFAVETAFVLLVYLVLALTLGGSIAPAAAVALFAVVSRFIEPLTRAADMANALRAAANGADRITELLEEAPLPEPAVDAVPGAPAVVYEDVAFGYDPGDRVVDGLSLRIPAGTTTALVGPSGSGKTTLLRLAARFSDVDAGRVLVGGHDVRDYRAATLLAQVSVVFQDVYLFEGGILDNIWIGRPEAPEEEVRRVAALARVDEIAARLPEGWDSQVGEGGAALSGGERQRISIARALLKDAPIVLLDEATSALDPQNEAAVVRALHELTRDRTVIVVAHRLSTIRHADQIAFLEGGRIAEVGDHEALLASGGRYAAFWTEREHAAGWRLERAGGRA